MENLGTSKSEFIISLNYMLKITTSGFLKARGKTTDSWTYKDHSFETSAVVIMAYNYVHRINEMKNNSNRIGRELFSNYDTYPKLFSNYKERNFYGFGNTKTIDLLCFFDEGDRDKMFYACYYINNVVISNGSFSKLIINTCFK